MWGNTSIKWCPDRNQPNSTIRRRQKARAISRHPVAIRVVWGQVSFHSAASIGRVQKVRERMLQPGH